MLTVKAFKEGEQAWCSVSYVARNLFLSGMSIVLSRANFSIFSFVSDLTCSLLAGGIEKFSPAVFRNRETVPRSISGAAVKKASRNWRFPSELNFEYTSLTNYHCFHCFCILLHISVSAFLTEHPPDKACHLFP